MHFLRPSGGGVIESEMVQQPMGDIQRQLSFGTVPAPRRLPGGQLAIDNEIEDPRRAGGGLIGQVEAQAIGSPLVIQKPLVEGSDFSITHNAYANGGLRDSEGKALSTPGGESLMLVRIAIRRSALKDAAKFTLSQLRLICGPKTGEGPLAGAGRAVYPIGYIGSGGRLERKSLAEIITIDASKVEGDVSMDVAFFVPTNLTPALVAFKRNNVVQVSSPASPEDAPQPLPFGASAPASQAAPSPEPRSEPAPTPPASDERREGSGLSDFSRSIVGDGLEEN